jgi:hypothetical protein
MNAIFCKNIALFFEIYLIKLQKITVFKNKKIQELIEKVSMQNRSKGMKKDDMPQFALSLAELGEIYAKNISEFLTDIYWKALEDFELQDVKKALRAHIHNPDCGQYFPKPADVVRFIEGSGETKALNSLGDG